MASRSDLDLEKAKQVAQTVVGDVATIVHGGLCYIGDRMGLFKAMMNAGPLTYDALADKAGLSPRYVKEWLGAMAAAHYVEYDAAGDAYLLTPEYAAALADEDSPFFIGSYFQMAQAAVTVAPKGRCLQERQGRHAGRISRWLLRGCRTQFAHALSP
jgi:hypothetical protein